ncbi:Cu2+-exporting ATPase [Exophiala aquamarina CBS 119918]|uniref:Cu2+-exporting ATPase n=1 Tax=Exophiala aquamarina CBS 119918 TaxID=1182545 RepID=A0A072PMW8_9EURO|nr:Cu2+-exporting ATPase [Exophiala aquamarina CBS 119918]KEF56860.1 Cu2+-exporting ATPase [Exophiala aquamarina CBS 119918]
MSLLDDTDLVSPEKPHSPHMATTTLKVDGMTCGACTSAVESAFKGVEGAGAISVSLMMGRAVVHHDPTKLPADKVAELIEDRGFDAEVLTTDMPQPTSPRHQPSLIPEEAGAKVTSTTIKVEGMTCGACTSAIEAGFKDVAGVKNFSISLLAGRAVVQHDANIIDADALAEIIEDRGFDATVLESKIQHSVKPNLTIGTDNEPTSGTWTTTVAIEGMTCGACTSSVERGFKDVEGLVKFNISLLAERAVISHSPAILPAAKIVEIIEDSGFDATVISSNPETALHGSTHASTQLKIYGLADGNAATELETALRSKLGVKNAVISLSTSRATISYDSTVIGLRVIVGTIEAAGYNALVADSEDNNAQIESLAKTKEIQEWKRAFITSLAFAIPVLLISMIIPMFLSFMDFTSFKIIPGLFLGDIICCALTVPVQFGIGKRFYHSAFKSLKHKSPTMDVLVVLGTSTAFVFSCFAMIVAVLIPPHNKPGTIFDTSTMLITFITLGRWLENRAKGQTSKALSALMSLAPSMATIYDDPLYAEKLADNWVTPTSPILEKTPTKNSFQDHPPAPSGTSGPSAVEKVIPTELLEVGDIVILRPGDKIPADGTVTRGESFVDESMVTGEAIPILKRKDSLLIAGTVNGAGKIDFKVTRAGKDTQLSQIVNLVQEAQTSRAPIQRMADLVAGYFVPVIIVLGLLTFVGWFILSHTLSHPPEIFLKAQSGGKFMVCLKLCISVIVFACPCALGLATPTAVMVGTGVASQHGILVKGGAALEIATRITHIVFDKTGTLTFGKLKVADTRLESKWNSNEEQRSLWWTLVGLAEAGSEHPIARSILVAAKSYLKLDDDAALPGHVGTFGVSVGQGISAVVELEASGTKSTRYKVHVGNAAFLHAKHIEIPSDVEQAVNSALSPITRMKSKTGITTIYTAINNEYAGILDLSDTLKPTAPAAITALHRMGISTSLITGDTYNTALSIGTLVGIPKDSIHAAVSPGDKQNIVAELQAQGEVVAMVGDGINDSPALATADIGMGLVSGSDIAVEAADIVIMRSDDLLNIPTALHLCRVFFRRIKMNLIWACAYNVIGLPFAMGIFLPLGYHMPPLMSATAMMFSSISVTLSSLALKWAGRPKWLTVEAMEMESSDIAVPVRGNRRRLGVIAKTRATILGLWDTTATLRDGKGWRSRKGQEANRGSYVPLHNVDEAV